MFTRILNRLNRTERGANFVEYALMLCAVFVASAAAAAGKL